jgi:hypothetical protein
MNASAHPQANFAAEVREALDSRLKVDCWLRQVALFHADTAYST